MPLPVHSTAVVIAGVCILKKRKRMRQAGDDEKRSPPTAAAAVTLAAPDGGSGGGGGPPGGALRQVVQASYDEGEGTLPTKPRGLPPMSVHSLLNQAHAPVGSPAGVAAAGGAAAAAGSGGWLHPGYETSASAGGGIDTFYSGGVDTFVPRPYAAASWSSAAQLSPLTASPLGSLRAPTSTGPSPTATRAASQDPLLTYIKSQAGRGREGLG